MLMFSLRDLLLLWSFRIWVSSYEMFLHCSYIVHWENSLRKSHFHTVLFFFYPLVCSECIFLRNSRECCIKYWIKYPRIQCSYLHCSFWNPACVNTNLGREKQIHLKVKMLEIFFLEKQTHQWCRLAVLHL